MQKYDVNCPSCCGTFVETTVSYNPKVYATGDMLTLKQQFKDNGWGSFPEYDSTTYADLVCPSCDAQYCNDAGKIIRLQATGETFDPPKRSPRFSHVSRGGTVRVTPFVPLPKKPDPLTMVTPVYEEDGRAQCPFCDKRVTRQWWDRHLSSHE